MRLLLVIGTRPQIIKSAPIIKEASNWPGVEFEIIHTGQHYDYAMSRELFNELSLPDPVINLNVGSGPHGWQTGNMLIGLEKTFSDLKPDLVLVPGDTNSTLAGCLAAAKMHVPVVHVESGARSFDKMMPEEMNRIVVDHLSSLLFSVSRNCVDNLKREGIAGDKVALVGDTMYESVQDHLDEIRGKKASKEFDVEGKAFGVVTLHRAENTDDESNLRRIIEGLNSLDMDLVFPVHPRTRVMLNKLKLLDNLRAGFRVVDPIQYYSMLNLVDDSSVVFTDSGGIQKEAFWFGTPCITLRTTTEWVETIEAGANVLVGSDIDQMKIEADRALNRGKLKVAGDAGGLFKPGASKNIFTKLAEWTKK